MFGPERLRGQTIADVPPEKRPRILKKVKNLKKSGFHNRQHESFVEEARERINSSNFFFTSISVDHDGDGDHDNKNKDGNNDMR